MGMIQVLHAAVLIMLLLICGSGQLMELVKELQAAVVQDTVVDMLHAVVSVTVAVAEHIVDVA